jgi:D-sedoheptulose 7-phosphate isomerase
VKCVKLFGKWATRGGFHLSSSLKGAKSYMLTDIVDYKKELDSCWNELVPGKLERIISQLMKRDTHIYIIGNGGSASTASHMAVDLAKGTQVKGFPSLRVTSLTDCAMITAWANDTNYDHVFEEQLKTCLRSRDTVIAISASGRSPNIISAVQYAKKVGATTIGFIGFGGGVLKSMVDHDITVSSKNYGVVEDFHLSLNHIISQYIKRFRERGEKWDQPSW